MEEEKPQPFLSSYSLKDLPKEKLRSLYNTSRLWRAPLMDPEGCLLYIDKQGITLQVGNTLEHYTKEYLFEV